MIPYVFGVIALLPPFIGLLVSDKNIFQSFYGTFAFLGGNADISAIGGSNWWLSIAAILTPIAVSTAVISYFHSIRKRFFLTIIKDHIVVCGLGRMGTALVEDMLQNHKKLKLVVIESDPSNKMIEELQAKGVVIVIGDTTQDEAFERAKVSKAKDVICLTGSDVINLEVAIKIANSVAKDRPTAHLHLSNRENYELLREDKLKDFTKQFSLYDNAAQTLFMQYPLGSNIYKSIEDLEDPDKVVRVAIIGFDKAGESIMYRALNLGHFYNGTPIEITVFDDDIEKKKRDFEKKYSIAQYTDYWKIDFKEEIEFYKEDKTSFTQIIFCSPKVEDTYADAMRLMKSQTKHINDKNVEVYLFADTNEKIAELIDNNQKEFKNLKTFGKLKEMCSYDVIVGEILDRMAMNTNAEYNNLHGYNEDGRDEETQWKELDVFLKDSNRMQVEHLPIKLKIITLFLNNKVKQGDYEKIKKDAKEKWFKHETEILWDKMKGAKILAEYLPADVIDTLAKQEHKRWNAFHILHGWKEYLLEDIQTKYDKEKDAFITGNEKYDNAKKELEKTKKSTGPISEEAIQNKIKEDNYRKNKTTKEQACLVSWEKLDSVSKFIGHDYKSDDVETVMRVSNMTKDAVLEKCFMKTHILDFGKAISDLEKNQ